VAAACRSGDEVAWESVGEIASKLKRDKRAAELLDLHGGLDVPLSSLAFRRAVILAGVEWDVAFMQGPVPDDVCGVAGKRVAQLLDLGILGRAEVMGHLVLAMVRLRQRRHDEAGQLCERALATENFPETLTNAFGMLYVVRQELGRPCSGVVGEAALRGLDAEGAAAAVRQVLSRDEVVAGFQDFEASGRRGPVQPSRTDRLLAAYRAGDIVALQYAGSIGAMLRAEGRAGELLELHASFVMPPGPYARMRADAMADLSYSVALLPGVPADVLGEAGRRVQWVLDGVEHEPGSLQLAAHQHTLAVIRMRQGRLSEVETLCASTLADRRVSPRDHATTLATVALARKELGKPHESLLAEAVALDPDADLVAEATGRAATPLRV
jgi:hypothetical protein